MQEGIKNTGLFPVDVAELEEKVGQVVKVAKTLGEPTTMTFKSGLEICALPTSSTSGMVERYVLKFKTLCDYKNLGTILHQKMSEEVMESLGFLKVQPMSKPSFTWWESPVVTKRVLQFPRAPTLHEFWSTVQDHFLMNHE